MNKGQTVFSQVIDFLPKKKFRQCVNRYNGDYRIRSFTCYSQFLCMAFAQLTYRESLRDIECCLRAMQSKLYHMGIRGTVARSTMADANEIRDWRIYGDFAQILIHEARNLYADTDFGLDLQETVYALDSSTIDLCLSMFPWARFRKTKSAVKLHTLLDLRGNSSFYLDHGWQSPRCHCARSSCAGIGCYLYHGSRLFGFSAALPYESMFSHICNTIENKHRLTASVFTSS